MTVFMVWTDADLADGAALAVAPVAQAPKVKGLAPGTTAWLRRRTAVSG